MTIITATPSMRFTKLDVKYPGQGGRVRCPYHAVTVMSGATFELLADQPVA